MALHYLSGENEQMPLSKKKSSILSYFPLLLILFHSSRNGWNFSYRNANWYRNTPRSTSSQISVRFGPFRSFRKIPANSSRYWIWPVIKKKKKRLYLGVLLMMNLIILSWMMMRRRSKSCIIWYLVIYLLELTILCSTRIYINYFLRTPKHPETVRRNRPVPKYSIPLDKPKRGPKRY